MDCKVFSSWPQRPNIAAIMQAVPLTEAGQHGSQYPVLVAGESGKGHAPYSSSGTSRAGKVIGMIASGLNGSHGSSTPPGSFSAHGCDAIPSRHECALLRVVCTVGMQRCMTARCVHSQCCRGAVLWIDVQAGQGHEGSNTACCRERLLVSALGRLGLSMSPTSSVSSGSGGPGTPARSSSGGSDDPGQGQGLRKGSPLSSVRTRLGGQAECGQSGMQR